MSCWFISVIRLGFVLSMVLIITACPGPGKIKKTVELNQALDLNKKFEKLFDESVFNHNTQLVFHSAAEAKYGITIYLNIKPGTVNPDWQQDIVSFQKKLKHTGTEYDAVLVNSNSTPSFFLYEPSYLEIYESSLGLFWKNLEQIKENRIEDLYQTMKITKLEYTAVKELFDFIQIKDFDHYKLEAYPANDSYGFQPIVFSLQISKTNKLYFSYLRAKSGTTLYSIDLNNYNSIINF